MRRKKNKQMEGQMSIFDMFSSVIENTKTEEENVTVSEGGIAAADITAVETGTQTSIFDLFSTDEQDTQKQEKKPKKNFFHRTIQFAKSLEDKWKNNLAALKMLLGLDDYADEDQQTILSSYEGWGGLSSYFEVEEKKVQLETLVGENTYKGIKSSILTSYYTNEKIINFMYQILSEIGVKGKLNILDPCMGTGNFYRMLPDTLQDSNLYGVELEETSCNIAKQLFQKANIQNCAFEKADLPDNYFDLIIGNVPFSDFSAADNTYGSCLIHDYFFLKALDLARPGGIVAMITTKGTMDKKSSRIRKMLAKKADLLCAIRLPETAFAVTGAKVSTDILFFQKRRYQTVGDEPEWVNIAQEANMYFGTHLNHMLGRMMEESGPYGKRFVCKEKEGMDWKACIDNFHLESYLKDVYEPGQTIENNDEEYVPAVDSISNMSYGIYNDHIYYRKNSMMKKIPDTGMVAKRIAAMIELRNVLKDQKAAVTYGTKRINGFLLLEKCLNLKDAKVYDTVYDENDNKKEVLNSKETTLAMGKQDEIREVFHSWIFKSYDRRCDLENIYNERFNSIRYRTFDGDFLKVPNMNSEIKLYKHQKDAIMRILFSKDNSLIGHKVGYGKTYTAIAAIMVAKRLKLSEKNLFVVPNPLVGQWGEEFMKLFPGANILVSSENDFTPAKRKEFCSKIATGSYDAIIIAQSQFQKIPISPEYQEKYIKAQIEELDKLLDSAEQNFTVRNIESSKKKLSVKLEKLQDSKRKDDVIYFDQLGVTKLIVDEAHYYKNLLLTTKMNNIAGINTSSNSKRAFDMFMKCQYMEENCRNKGIVFLTGTPVSNSMAEVYTMQRYLQLNTLKELGIDSFDSWASTFGETKTAMELAPEGTGYRARTRFTRFVGLAELLTIFKEVADIKVKDIKEMDVPNAVMETISIDASDEQKKYVDGLASRAARIRDGGVDPSEDNMLKVTNEGRKLALDQRLVGIEEENFNSKAKYCVNQVMDIYEKYPGKTQVIFLDLSTPKKGEFNVYDDVKAKLIERGIPEGEIAFIHSAKTNKQKVDLCKKVNEGVIRVLLGSTDKAGTGCNFQKKLIALHDLDCPWRPSDLTQRSGRIIRQGNFNKEVYIYRYVTKNTFDSYLWQTVENKQRYIGQILSEENIPRRMEEDDLTLSFAEIKAAACGNPLIKEQMELTQQVKRLKMQKNNFLNQYYELESYISKIAPNRIEQYKKNIENIEKDIEVAKKYHTGDFHIKVLDKYDSDTRAEANKIIHNIQPSYKNERKIASYQGFDIILDRKSVYSHQTMIIRGNYDYEFEFSGSTNIMYQIDKIIEYGILEELKTFKRRLEFESRKFVTAKTELNPDFPHESELIKKQARLSELNQKLSA